MGAPRNPLYGPFYGGMIPQGGTLRDIPPMPAPQLGNGAPGPNWRFGGMLTYEKPIVEFFPDVVIGASANVLLQAGQQLPRNCVGVRFIGLLGSVYASINGGGGRTILNNDVLSGCEIHSLQIVTDAAGAVTVQAVGTGD